MKLKKIVSELESYMYNDNKDKMHELLKRLIDLSNSIDEQIHEEAETIDDDYLNNVGLKFISSVPFLFKPILKKNYYEGNYLEMFSEQRSDELKRAKALEIHNKFWLANNVEQGNIFGSIPRDLVSKESANMLITYGWKSVQTIAYDVDKGIRLSELVSICKKCFDNYLIVTERRENQLIVLEYKL